MTAKGRDIWSLIQALETRIELDYRRMRRWRNFHRTTGVFYTSALLVLPAMLAVGFLSSETLQGKTIAFLITVFGGLNAAFQPMLHSHRRRADMNTSRQLLDLFRATVAKEQNSTQRLPEIYEEYAKRFAAIYAQRGEGLMDSQFALQHGTRKDEPRSTPSTRS